jgi:hypothetical protein
MNRFLPVLLAIVYWISSVQAFTAAPVRSLQRSFAPTTELYFFGQPKDDGSPGDYVCKVRKSPTQNIQ